MLKNLCQLEYEKENNECRLLCNNDAPTPFLKEALFQFQKYIGKIEDAAAAQQKEQLKSEETDVESPESLVPEVNPQV